MFRRNNETNEIQILIKMFQIPCTPTLFSISEPIWQLFLNTTRDPKMTIFWQSCWGWSSCRIISNFLSLVVLHLKTLWKLWMSSVNILETDKSIHLLLIVMDCNSQSITKHNFIQLFWVYFLIYAQNQLVATNSLDYRATYFNPG